MQRRNKNRDQRQAFPSELGRSVTDGVEIEDLQYQAEKSRPPYGTILIAAFFFIAGTCCLFLSAMIFAGQMEKIYDDRAFPALLIGCIMFIPGSYYMYIVICVLLRVPDYTFDRIPQFNN